MIKGIIGFILFAALGIWLLTRGGGDIDLGGEKHEAQPAAEHKSAEPKSAEPKK
jgi:ABC-type nickel/cobalt efflux system permease component RcnA